MSMSATKEGEKKPPVRWYWYWSVENTVIKLFFVWTYSKCTIQNISYLQRLCHHCPGLNLNVTLGTSYKVTQGCHPFFCWSITSIPETGWGKVINYLWSTPECDAELILYACCGLTLTENSAPHSCQLASLRVAWGRELEE